MNIRHTLLKLSLPVTRLMNQLHISPSRRAIKSADYRDAAKLLVPGDILLTFKKGELSNLFIPGDWSHAALYIGNDKVREATYKGVHDSDLIDFMLAEDRMIVLRPRLLDNIIKEAIDASVDALGRGYDFLFEKNDKSFYCSELIWWSYREACLNLGKIDHLYIKTTKTLGEQTCLPDDLRASSLFPQVPSAVYPKA